MGVMARPEGSDLPRLLSSVRREGPEELSEKNRAIFATCRILLVDDDPERHERSRARICSALQGLEAGPTHALDVLDAYSLAEARAMLRRLPPVSLLLVDHIPGGGAGGVRHLVSLARTLAGQTETGIEESCRPLMVIRAARQDHDVLGAALSAVPSVPVLLSVADQDYGAVAPLLVGRVQASIAASLLQDCQGFGQSIKARPGQQQEAAV